MGIMGKKMKMNDENNLIFTVDYDKLLQVGIKINHLLFLKILERPDRTKLWNYHAEQSELGPIVRATDLDYLYDKGFIDFKDKSVSTNPDSKLYFKNYNMSNLVLTETYESMFTKPLPNNFIEELKATYPTKTPAKKRRLQSDQRKWEPKYLSIVKGKPELHQLIIRCIQAEAKHRRATGSEEFWLMLSTYLNNNRWEDYAEDASEEVKEEVSKDYDI
jgi:hypothetical protein